MQTQTTGTTEPDSWRPGDLQVACFKRLRNHIHATSLLLTLS
jgi:hypothetical protein